MSRPPVPNACVMISTPCSIRSLSWFTAATTLRSSFAISSRISAIGVLSSATLRGLIASVGRVGRPKPASAVREAVECSSIRWCARRTIERFSAATGRRPRRIRFRSMVRSETVWYRSARSFSSALPRSRSSSGGSWALIDDADKGGLFRISLMAAAHVRPLNGNVPVAIS